MVPLSSTAVHESSEQTLKDRESVDNGHVDLSVSLKASHMPNPGNEVTHGQTVEPSSPDKVCLLCDKREQIFICDVLQ